MTDPISDMLTRIRNAYAVRKPEIVLPVSKFKYNLAKLLVDEGWLSKVEKVHPVKYSRSKFNGVESEKNQKNKNGNFDQLKITLKYNKSGKPAISSLKKVSKPGRRVYCDYKNLPRVLNNFGIAVISTSKGLMTNKQARKEKMGGEVICEIY